MKEVVSHSQQLFFPAVGCPANCGVSVFGDTQNPAGPSPEQGGSPDLSASLSDVRK